MSYVKQGKAQKKPGRKAKEQVTVNRERQHLRATAAKQRRFLASLGPMLGGPDKPREGDHLPGSKEDRFGQVYRKGGVRDGVDSPNDARSGRGYATPEVR